MISVLALALVASLTATPTGPPVATPAPIEGTWTAKTTDDAVRMALTWSSSYFRREVPVDAFEGAVPRRESSGPVAFRLARAPGVLAFEGAYTDGAWGGRFRFEPDAAFAQGLAETGIEAGDGADASALLDLALADARLPAVRALVDAGLGPLTLDDVVRLSVLDVTGAYVRSMRAAGVRGVTLEGAVVLRVRDVTPAYVASLAAAGYPGLSAREASDLRARDVTAETIAELRALGYDALPPADLVAMAVLGVTPAYIRSVRERGAGALTVADLLAMRGRASD